MKYAIVIEKAEGNYGADVPDLPGCVATGQTVEETLQQIQEAIAFHLKGMLLHGEVIPEPTGLCQCGMFLKVVFCKTDFCFLNSYSKVIDKIF